MIYSSDETAISKNIVRLKINYYRSLIGDDWRSAVDQSLRELGVPKDAFVHDLNPESFVSGSHECIAVRLKIGFRTAESAAKFSASLKEGDEFVGDAS